MGTSRWGSTLCKHFGGLEIKAVLTNGRNGLRSIKRNSITGSAQHTLRRRTQVDNDAVGKGRAGRSRAGEVRAYGKAAASGLGWGRDQLGSASGHARCTAGEITIPPSSGLGRVEDGILLLWGQCRWLWRRAGHGGSLEDVAYSERLKELVCPGWKSGGWGQTCQCVKYVRIAIRPTSVQVGREEGELFLSKTDLG